jgi:hypothetical protein
MWRLRRIQSCLPSWTYGSGTCARDSCCEGVRLRLKDAFCDGSGPVWWLMRDQDVKVNSKDKGQSQQFTSSTVFLLQTSFTLSRVVRSHAPPCTTDQPSNTRSTTRRLPDPSPPALTSTDNTISSRRPLPSPPGPNTSRSLSYPRSLTGRNTPQNLAGADKGGGGVK